MKHLTFEDIPIGTRFSFGHKTIRTPPLLIKVSETEYDIASSPVRIPCDMPITVLEDGEAGGSVSESA